MNYQLLIISFVVLSVIYFLLNEPLKEKWGTSPATLMQLAAKGSQDIYLTGEIVHPGYYHHHTILPYYQFDHDYRNYPNNKIFKKMN